MNVNILTRREALRTLGAFAGALALPASAYALARRDEDKKASTFDFAHSPVQVTKLTPAISLLTGPGGNIALLTGEDGPVLVDTGVAGRTEEIIKAVQTVTPMPLRFVIDTHWHADHTGGNAVLGKAGATLIAHENTRTRLSTDQEVEMFHMKVPAMEKSGLPIVTFRGLFALDQNGEEIHCIPVPPAHTDSDIIVHFRKANVVHAGDIVFNGFYPFIDYSSKGWIGGMIAASARVISLSDAQTKIIPGHGPIATRADVEAYHSMLVGVQDKIKPMVDAGKSVEEVVAAKPTAEYDARWGSGLLNPEIFTRVVYLGLMHHKA